MVVIVWSLDLQLPVQSVPINTFESHSGEVYSIQHYAIKFVSDLQWFSPGNPVSSTNKAALHDITEILLESGIEHHKSNQPPVGSSIHVCIHHLM